MLKLTGAQLDIKAPHFTAGCLVVGMLAGVMVGTSMGDEVTPPPPPCHPMRGDAVPACVTTSSRRAVSPRRAAADQARAAARLYVLSGPARGV